MTKEIRDSFIMYRSFIDAARDLPKIERVDLYDAIFDLALDGKENKLNGSSSMLFKVIKPNILANTKRYKDGKKGGRKSTKKTSGSENEKPVGGVEKEPNKDKDYNYNENKDVKSEIIIPNFIDQILFNEFLQQRKKDKNPLEKMALKLVIEDLEKWESKKTGNANQAIKNAIKGGWKSLVEPKENQSKFTDNNKDLAAQINEIAGVNYVDKVIIEGDLTKIKCKSPASQANFCELPTDKKDKIKALFKGNLEFIC